MLLSWLKSVLSWLQFICTTFLSKTNIMIVIASTMMVPTIICFCSCSLWGCKGFSLKIGWGQEQNISTGSLLANELNTYDIITSKQHGFRKGMSCETQLVEAIHDWTTILNKGQGQVDVILLDFSKAFDTVPHQRIFTKNSTNKESAIIP